MTNKFNQNYTYKPRKNLSIKEVINGVVNADTNVLAQAITMLESKNQKDRLLIYDALSEINVSQCWRELHGFLAPCTAASFKRQPFSKYENYFHSCFLQYLMSRRAKL